MATMDGATANPAATAEQHQHLQDTLKVARAARLRVTVITAWERRPLVKRWTSCAQECDGNTDCVAFGFEHRWDD